MGKMEEEGDVGLVKTEKKSKKSKKNNTNDLLDLGEGTVSQEKGHKHKEKKKKSESNEGGDLPKEEKKKRKRDSSESEDTSEKVQIEVAEQDCDPKPRKEKKREHKHHENDKGVHDSKSSLDKDISSMKENVSGDKEKNTEGGRKKRDGKGIESSSKEFKGDLVETTDKKKKKTDENTSEDVGSVKTEKKKKKTKDPVDIGDGFQKEKGHKHREKKRSSEPNEAPLTTEHSGAVCKAKKKRNKDHSETDQNEQGRDDGSSEKEKPDSQKSTEESQGKKKKPKKVSFSSNIELFPPPDKHVSKEDGLVRGKRFTPEEDAILKDAVLNYIETHSLGEDGLQKVLNCSKHGLSKKCWKEIGKCIPYRPSSAIYHRAHNLFERAEKREWAPEEIEYLKEFYQKHGNDWKKAGLQMGKHRTHVKDTWRRIKFGNGKTRKQWTHEVYQKLFDLVNLDLRMKMCSDEEKHSKHGMLRDNIPWTAISEKVFRDDATCCNKWYKQLTSSLVAEKKWTDGDDYRLIGALYELGAVCEEDVDWEGLLEHRPGEVCRKRWNQMVKHISRYWIKPFVVLVDTLANRYVPELAQVRDAWDNKPLVT